MQRNGAKSKTKSNIQHQFSCQTAQLVRISVLASKIFQTTIRKISQNSIFLIIFPLFQFILKGSLQKPSEVGCQLFQMVRRHEFSQQLLSLDYSKNSIEVQMSSKTQGKQASKPTKGDPSVEPHPSPPSLLSESINNSAPTALPNANLPINFNYSIYDQEEKVIPGYNFQSLFRKKSHIKLSKKKNKEQTMKRSFTLKNQAVEKESKNIQKGHWTHEENKLYHYFLEIHNRHFILKHLRRTDKIFKSMANFMKSRQAEQCRSHHQKMEKKYHNFYQILIKLRMDFYNTLNPDELALQLEQKGYKIRQNNIIKEEQLRNGDLNSKQPRQQKIDDLDSDQSIEISQQNGHMLSQNYENDLDFKKMHFQT